MGVSPGVGERRRDGLPPRVHEHDPRFGSDLMQRRSMLIIAAVGVPLAICLTWMGMPVAGPDDALFKAPAAELVQHGRYAAPSLVGWFPRSDEYFAAYPIGYGALLAAWYALCGVSLRSSLACSQVVHVLTALAAAGVTFRLLRAQQAVADRAVAAAATWIGLLHCGQLGQFERPEEPALLALWCEFLFAAEVPQKSWRSWAFSGLLIGWAALTSPWVGVLGAVFLALRTLAACLPPREARAWPSLKGLCLSGAIVVSMLAGWYVCTEWSHPGFVHLQLFGHGDNALKYQVQGNLADKMFRFWTWTLNTNRPRMLILGLALVAVPAAPLIFRRVRLGRELWCLYLTSVLGIATIAFVRPGAFTYFHATYSFLLPCLGAPFAAALGTGSAPRRVAATLALLTVTGLAFKTAAKNVREGFVRDAAHSPFAVYDHLREIIPPGDRVATSPVHWHAFQNRNPWIDLNFAVAWSFEPLEQCDWVVLGYAPSSRWIEEFDLPDFDRVEELAPTTETHMSYGYSLWKRVRPPVGEMGPQE